MKEKNVHEKLCLMENHDEMKVNNYIRVLKVPAGWVYIYSDNNGAAMTFVPYVTCYHQNTGPR
jgi:hypothetical protein